MLGSAVSCLESCVTSNHSSLTIHFTLDIQGVLLQLETMSTKSCEKVLGNGYQCDQPRAPSSDSESAGKVIYCSDHSGTCRRPECLTDISAASQDPPYSQYREAHYSSALDCSRALKADEPGHKFCHQHRCRIVDCDGPGASRQNGRDFCDCHRCEKPSYEYKSKAAEKGPSESPYCSVHCCKRPDCNEMRDGETGLCSEHIVCYKKRCQSAQHKSARFLPRA